ncbi:MAG: hypothetical protein OHK0048_15820 [Rhodoferax sp.]
MPNSISSNNDSPAVDVTRRFVRVTRERGAFVEFDFAIGWPELYVELVLPRSAFEDFCVRNQVVLMDPLPEHPTHQPDDEEI